MAYLFSTAKGLKLHPGQLLPLGVRFCSKMLPPFSAVSSEGQTGPRTGFFHDFKSREVYARRYIPVDEEFERDPISGDELERLGDNLKTLDQNLGSYPYGDWKKWVSLTNKISPQTISR